MDVLQGSLTSHIINATNPIYLRPARNRPTDCCFYSSVSTVHRILALCRFTLSPLTSDLSPLTTFEYRTFLPHDITILHDTIPLFSPSPLSYYHRYSHCCTSTMHTTRETSPI